MGKFDIKGYKEDTRPQRGMWAPGNYLQHCVVCNDGFIGDKRAYICADCSYKDEERYEQLFLSDWIAPNK